MVDGVPSARLKALSDFSTFFGDGNGNVKDPALAHERLCWELADVLFGEVQIPEELDDVADIEERLRKDRLSTFWERIVEPASSQHVAMARSSEEKAIAALTGHRIADACNHLITGKDYRLATLVALIGNGVEFQKEMRSQLTQWQESAILSEFSQPVRAIYEMLAGRVCVCAGRKGLPEDRIESFIISKRFGLDWRQAFGLRLWYATVNTDGIAAAVAKFDEDLCLDREPAEPVPWFVEQKIPTLWEDKNVHEREDVLWSLLKLYTDPALGLERVIEVEDNELSPMDYRFVWQMSRALEALAGKTYSESPEIHADRLSLAFASQLTGEGKWREALFVLLHLSSATSREKALRDQLAHHAKFLDTDDAQLMRELTEIYRIPVVWIWEAKALYMRSVERDPVAEVACLQNANLPVEAHRTLVKNVAPQAVIERDYTTLETLLARFTDTAHLISDWALGGQIYHDYLRLVQFDKKTSPLDHAVLDRLLGVLPSAAEESRDLGFVETVALEIIAADVAKVVVEMESQGVSHVATDIPSAFSLTISQNTKLARVLKLPLTEDQYLKHTTDLSLAYYRQVVGKVK